MSVEGKPDLLEVLRHYQVDVVDGRVEQLVRCPVHSEDRASCSVNTVKQVFNCKACAAQGDSLTLIQIKEGLKDFAATIEAATRLFGTVPGVPARGGRKGLLGESRPARGGWKPAYRRSGLQPREG